MQTSILSDLAGAVQNYVSTHKHQMIAVLETLVRTESPTGVQEAQIEVQTALTRLLHTLSYEALSVPGNEQYGPHLYARPAAHQTETPVQLLVGHSDTVWPQGTLQEMPFEVDGNSARGPGIFDMKAGLVQMIFALSALRVTGIDLEVTPIVFINSDEEHGSPTSRRHLRRLACCADRVFVLEPALGLDGKLKTARKGGGRFTVSIEGKRAHAGLDPESGSSAILELSHVVQRLHALNDADAGISVNVGTIDGGSRPNVVANASRAEVDVRVATHEQAREIERTLRCLEPTTSGTSLTIEGGIDRPPMERTPASRELWKRARQVAQLLDVDLQEDRSGGVSDGNITAQYAPTLDGLGAVGDGAHAQHEFCYVDKMIERSAILALLLAQPPLTAPSETDVTEPFV